jgi:hypothetical protein
MPLTHPGGKSSLAGVSGVRYFVSFLAAVLRQWGVIVSGGVIVGLIALFEHFSGRSLAGWPLKVAIGLSLLAAVFFAWRKERQQWERVGGLAPLSATPRELMSAYDGRTTSQGEKLAEAYKGKWLKVEGTISDAVEYGLTMALIGSSVIVTLAPILSYGMPAVFLRFGIKWRSPLSVLTSKETIVVLGQIEKVEKHNIWLKRCELLEVRVAQPETENKS